MLLSVLGGRAKLHDQAIAVFTGKTHSNGMRRDRLAVLTRDGATPALTCCLPSQKPTDCADGPEAGS